MAICGHLGQMKNLAALARCPLLRGKFKMVRLIRMVQSLIPQLAAVYTPHEGLNTIRPIRRAGNSGYLAEGWRKAIPPFFFWGGGGGGGMEKVIYKNQRMPLQFI